MGYHRTVSDITLLHLVCDYAPDGLEFAEIRTRLVSHLQRPETVLVAETATPPLDTVAVGFVTGQLALAPAHRRMVVFGNSAPRRDRDNGALDNRGRRLRYALLDSGVEVVGVNSEYAFSFVRDRIARFAEVSSPVAGSQFRSRDFFPKYVAAIVDGDLSVLGEELDPTSIDPIPLNQVAWTDGFGNNQDDHAALRTDRGGTSDR